MTSLRQYGHNMAEAAFGHRGLRVTYQSFVHDGRSQTLRGARPTPSGGIHGRRETAVDRQRTGAGLSLHPCQRTDVLGVEPRAEVRSNIVVNLSSSSSSDKDHDNVTSDITKSIET